MIIFFIVVLLPEPDEDALFPFTCDRRHSEFVSTDELQALRIEIDAIDDRILALLNDRARCAALIAALKEKLDLPFYVPSRERAILDRLAAASSGPFPGDGVRAVFREIISACLALQR